MIVFGSFGLTCYPPAAPMRSAVQIGNHGSGVHPIHIWDCEKSRNVLKGIYAKLNVRKQLANFSFQKLTIVPPAHLITFCDGCEFMKMFSVLAPVLNMLLKADKICKR